MAISLSRLTDRLEFQARHDALTRLFHRGSFLELLEAALVDARGLGETLSVLFIDLDRFQQINDTLGYVAGDALLSEAAHRIKRLFDGEGTTGRLGSDEFGVLLRRCDEVSAIDAAEKCQKALGAAYRIDGHELFITASIGIAMFPEHGGNATDLLQNADLAKHQAKQAGTNGAEIFQAEKHARGLEQFRLENALRRALDNGEFDLRYQPVVNKDGTLDGLEALLTWRHPVYGAISPRRFIPMAEEIGMIVPIGGWVIERACLEGARWQRRGYRNARVSVNVSAMQFCRRDFVQTVADALETSGYPPENLGLELTESCVMRSLADSANSMTQIRGLGVGIAIDDFGTGYSSLAYLNRLPVDALKIDQSFLQRLQEPQGSLPMVQSIVRLAHGMNLAVVAEGVETIDELDLVRVLGCDKVQGHVYGGSLGRAEAEAVLARDQIMAPLKR